MLWPVAAFDGHVGYPTGEVDHACSGATFVDTRAARGRSRNELKRQGYPSGLCSTGLVERCGDDGRPVFRRGGRRGG